MIVEMLRTHRSRIERIESRIPLLNTLHGAIYERRFAKTSKWARIFRGVYDSFEEATRAAPKSLPVGFDNRTAATFLIQDEWKVLPSDYPVMFWLARTLPASKLLFDFGGYVGISYYSYKRYLDYPESLDWKISDVEEVTKAGARLAVKNGRGNLSFTNRFEECDGADILLACGSLQYVETPLSSLLANVARKPRHIILNKMPLHESPTFVTLQNIGPAVCPYYIFNRKEFVDSVCGTGYELIDTWENAEFGAKIPFYPERSVERFSGLYFRRE